MTSHFPFWLARQPILDLTGKTVGYELLFRSDPVRGATITDNGMATASVISHAFNELGIASVLGGGRGFINFDTPLLMSDVVELLPPEMTVIELLETVEFTPSVIERCRQLRSRGFSFALDDIVHEGALHDDMMPLVEIAKVDVLATDEKTLAAIVTRAKLAGHVKLLAEKVDTHEQANRCRTLGFQLFQGYFFARPMILQGRRADPSRQVLLELLEQSLGDTDNGSIERTFKQAPELSYKLMRVVNSVGMGMRTSIQSLSHALAILGRRQLQRWLQVLLFAHQSTGDFPSPLLQLAAGRGKLMELLAEQQSKEQAHRDRAFMVGILSLLDTLLETPMSELIGQLNLPDDVRSALLDRGGPFGHLLSVIEALERADDRGVAKLLADGDPCPTTKLPQLQIAALSWATSIGKPLEQAADVTGARRSLG